MDDYVIINGKKAKILHNTSKSKDWSIEDANIDTLKVFDELIKFLDSSVKYESGITVSNPKTTVELVGNLGVTRPSNHVGIIRHELPVNTVFTFKFKGDKFPRYGIAKSEKSKKAIKEFREHLLRNLLLEEAKADASSRNN